MSYDDAPSSRPAGPGPWAIALGICLFGLLACAALYYLLEPSPHCARWETVRETSPAYVEYDWNGFQGAMVRKEIPAETWNSWSYCAAAR